MDNLLGKWIWFEGEQSYNQIGCFADEFNVDNLCDTITLRISAETKYELYINGQFVGRGPIRSTIDRWYYDEYNIIKYIKKGGNYCSIRVWDYGISTYQTIWTKGGLIYDITQGDKLLVCSNEYTKSTRDIGLKHNTVKRNVNMGYMEYYVASNFDFEWIYNNKIPTYFNNSAEVDNNWGVLHKNNLNQYQYDRVYPNQIISIFDVEKRCQQVSVYMRDNFFPNKTDANEVLFGGFIGVIIDSKVCQKGTISFPCRTWNGIMGTFKVDDTLYKVCNEHRDIEVNLKVGKQLFLMEISGKFDDVFTHIEFKFDEEIEFNGLDDKTSFFTIGPTITLNSGVNGYDKVYGGLIEYDELEDTTPLHKDIFCSNSLEEILRFKDIIKHVSIENVFYDEYIYSNVKNSDVVKSYPIKNIDGGMLWNNTQSTKIDKIASGYQKQIIIDFGDIYVGNVEFSLVAPQDVKLDFYFFENMYDWEIDYTIGLNNSFRYTTKRGIQKYKTISRFGGRYCVITIDNCNENIELIDFSILNNTYSTYNNAFFKSNDYLLNRIWEISKRTHLLCCEDTFTDSPTYEQAFWVGDAQVSAQVNAYIFGQYELIRHCLELVPLSNKNTPLLNALLPTDWNTVIPLWSMNWILAIEQYITNTDDKEVIKKLYKHVCDLLDYFFKFITEDGGFLINAWNMLDWAALDIYNHCVVAGQQAVLCRCYEIGASFSLDMGDNDKANEFNTYRAKMIGYIDAKLWDEERKCFVDGWSPDHGYSKTVSIQTHTLLSLFNAIKDKTKRSIVNKYLYNPPEYFLKAGSPFFLFYIYETWAKQGKIKNILTDIKDKWGGMLRYDSTTCWEVFPGFYEVGRTRSYCHSWSSSPVYFINKYILGINMIENGFKKAEIFVPENDLEWCQGSLPTPYGIIKIRWSKANDQNIIKLQIPKEIEVTVRKDFDWKIEITQIK